MGSLEDLQDLYDRNLFLDAFRQSAEYWKPSVRLADLSIEELILGGRLASRLGGSRLSRWLFRAAFARDPSNPKARYYTSYIRRRGWHLFDELRTFEANPEIDGIDAETQSSRLAYHAVICASLRDFAHAHEYIERARTWKARDSWVLSCESDVLGYEDRWTEALQSAELAWEINPGTPYVARSLAGSLLNLRRVQEAAERLSASAENGQSYEIASLGCWYLCALAETHSGDERTRTLNRARQLADKLEMLAPLADRESRAQFARTRLDMAETSDDHEAMERWAAEARSPFHRKILENLRANPKGLRIRLPFRHGIQKHNACLPTSLASALAAGDVHIDPDMMASEITFGGTPEWAAAEWLEKRGLESRYFVATPEVSANLIKHGIAFVMTLEGDASAHAVAAVGLDEAAGTLIIHDPQSFRTTEYLLKSIGKNHAPLGPRGMAVVPREKALLLDQLLPKDDAETMAAAEAYRREHMLHGTAAAQRVVADLAERHPTHPVTQLLHALQSLEEGRTGNALSGFQQLLKAFPSSAFVRANLLASCRSIRNTALMRETLAGVVERGMLPGIQSQQEWLYPPAAYVSEYADLLRASAETRNQARSMLHSVIRQQSSCGPAWHILGDLLWHEHDIDGALLAYRIGSCLADNNEHYAMAFCDALCEAGREDEGFQWLENRVRTFGSFSRAVATWVTWISALENWGRPEQALAASAEALRQHPDVPELLTFIVPFAARMGRWDEAGAFLRQLEAGENSGLFCAAAVDFYRMRGDLEKSIQYAEQGVLELPLSMRARHDLIDLIAKRDGNSQAVARARSWMAEHPGHDEMEELYCQQLDRVSAPPWKKYSILLRRLKRNPQDAWAWRELSFTCIYEYESADTTKRAKLEQAAINFMAQCDCTSPGDSATLRLHAQWREARGEWSEAVDRWMEAIDHAPGSLYSYRHAWDCSTRLDAGQRQEVWTRMQALLLGCPGRLLVARETIMMAAHRFGVAAAEQAVSNWNKVRPDDPEAIEAHVDLLLSHGHGRTDFERALQMLVPAVERFPYHSGLRFSQADALRKLGKFTEAEIVLAEIARRHPSDSSAQIQMARVQERHGQIDEALRTLDSAATRDPQNTNLFDVKVQILIRASRFTEARATIGEISQRFPGSVHWRERAIDLLLDCGDTEAAVQTAREGVLEYPRGAYLWLLLGKTLSELRQLAAQGEIEFSLRCSLALNQGLFEAADYLVMLLVEQRRYSEAGDIMLQIAPRLGDPSPARGRLAWVHRKQGQKDQALAELISLLRDAPWYRWGWGTLMDWLVEDEAWEKVRDVLGAIPPEVRTDTQFRQRRLVVLEKAGLPVTGLDSEWNTLLLDFPEDVPLHLLRYDSLWQSKRWSEAAAVIDLIRPVDPDSPFVLARLVEVLAHDGKKDEALETLMRVFFAETEPSTWPANYAWEAVRKARYDEEAYQKARGRLQQGGRPTSRALSIVAAYALERGQTQKKTLQPVWRTWFPDPGAREVLSLLKSINSSSFYVRSYAAELLRQLSDMGYHRLVVRHWKKHRKQVEADIDSWSEIARALTGLKSNGEARRFMAGWRERAGVGMWVVANFVVCCSPFRRKQLREVLSSCRDALAGLPHDHCARYLAHMEAEACALLGDQNAFLETWQKHRNYFDGALEKNEWFEVKRRHLLTDVPIMARFLEERQRFQYKKMLWRLRWKRVSSKLRVSKSSNEQINIRWWWILWLLLWIMIQFFRNY